jgi:putative selenium metabolism hydrolase
MLTDQQHAQVIACCQELVRARSFAGREQDAAQVAERWMRQLGYDEVWVDEYGSVVGQINQETPTASGPHLHFDGHLDTVPATARDAWSRDPFGADLADGAIWGRGTTDMKGPLAAMLCAAAFVPRERLRGPVTVSASVAEEELEGPALVAILARKRPDVVVIGESTALRVAIGQKGRAGIRVATHGKPAHSSLPQDGKNAVYRMLDVTQRLRTMPLPDDDLLGPGVLELVELVSSPYPGTSIVPDGCTARWDRRTVRGETREQVLAAMRAALADLDFRVDLAYLDVQVPCYTGSTLHSDDFHPAWDIAADHPLVQAALAALASAGLPASIGPVPYCTNGSGSAGELGIPTIILGPGDPSLLHVVDEHITVEQLTRGTAVYMQLLDGLTL